MTREEREKRGGYITWGDSMVETLWLTGAQWHALYVLYDDREKTRTKEAFVSKTTKVFDHKVTLSATAVRYLEARKLVVTWYEGSETHRWRMVAPADRTVIAFNMERLPGLKTV